MTTASFVGSARVRRMTGFLNMIFSVFGKLFFRKIFLEFVLEMKWSKLLPLGKRGTQDKCYKFITVMLISDCKCCLKISTC